MKFSYCMKLIKQFAIIYNCFLIRFDQTINLFSTNSEPCSHVWCCVLWKIYLYNLPKILYKYDLCWHFFTTYFEVIVAATLGKSSQSKWYLNEAMASGSFAPKKAKNCKQHDLFVLSLYIYICIYICIYIYIHIYNVATYITIK